MAPTRKSPPLLIQERLLPPNQIRRKKTSRKNTSRKYSSLKKKLSLMGFQNKEEDKSLIKDIIHNNNNNKDDLFNILFDIKLLKPKTNKRRKKAVSFTRPKSYKIKKYSKHYSI